MQTLYDSETYSVTHMLANGEANGQPAPGAVELGLARAHLAELLLLVDEYDASENKAHQHHQCDEARRYPESACMRHAASVADRQIQIDLYIYISQNARVFKSYFSCFRLLARLWAILSERLCAMPVKASPAVFA